jgi:hypothetical protein
VGGTILKVENRNCLIRGLVPPSSSKGAGSFKDAWEDALDYVRHFPRETLESQGGFYSDVYRPKRDEFAAKWTGMSGSTPAKIVKRKEKASGK